MARLSSAIAAVLLVWLGGRAPAAEPVQPFADPPFASLCVVHHFGEGEAPPLDQLPDDPLCVEYEKRDITASNGGAVRFLAAEPARFAIAIPKCRYWQQDHWSIQLAPGAAAIVAWDGSYWFDKGSGAGAARLRNFTMGGQAAGPGQVADLIEPLDPDMAALIRRYGEGSGGGGGATICVGAMEPVCAASEAPTCADNPCGAATRAKADAECGCTTAASHARYVRCVGAVAESEEQAGRLPPGCRDDVVRCASHSTCGRPGAVTCCRTAASGTTTCGIKHDGARCRAPHGGGACVGGRTSCCDACTASGCAS